MNAATPHFDDHALIEVLPHGLMFFLDSTYSHEVRKKTVCAAQLKKHVAIQTVQATAASQTV
jgi:hypothetical protein